VSLLTIEDVSKRYRRGSREYVALRGVSLAVQRGELVVVLGSRKSGRSTLLRVAAGLERPDKGVVRFEGAPLSTLRDVVGRQISYCHCSFSAMEGERVLDQIATARLARRVSLAEARRAAEGVLEQVGASGCGVMRPDELNGVERTRVAIARSLVTGPSVLIVDDPTDGIVTLQGGGILRLLRTIADGGVAVLMSTDDATALSGADHALSLDDGRLRVDVQAPQAEVVPLRPAKLGLASGAHLA
jgi:putative ABC transport system ATP-binding protein